MSFANSVFNQFLSLISRSEFNKLEKENYTGRKPRTFSLWSQFVHLMFIQITERKSLRAGIRNMTVSKKHLYHLGAKQVSRSTFSDANNNRSASFFEALFYILAEKTLAFAPKHKFPFDNPLYSADASTIVLNKSSFPWAHYRSKEGGIKLHTLLNHNGYLPSVIIITNAKVHDVQRARSLQMEKGSIVVFDRGYNDYDWFAQLENKGIFFVTRLKSNADYTVVRRRPVNKGHGVTSDQLIRLKKRPDLLLRRIGYKDPETNKHYIFLTNHFDLDAKTIADIYKERWEIETFFRWIKQNLKIKTFVGRSENAVLTQIYVALILYLLLALLKFSSKIDLSMQNILQILQLNLFSNVGIEDLLKPPDKTEKCKQNNQLLLPV